jgi:hypothetical protein
MPSFALELHAAVVMCHAFKLGTGTWQTDVPYFSTLN